MLRTAKGLAPILAAAIAALPAVPAAAQQFAASVEDLRGLSIDELANLEITSVSRGPQSVSDAPAAVYVITHDAIVRSGATQIPEILRLAPNLRVIRTGASRYVVTARGFSGSSTAQAYSNKLLVLIDGRSVYTPLFSGVYWDMQDIPPDEIERIEVISGPGATLWGANAVNGVINIITRNAGDTQGGLAEVTAGNLDQSATLQYGGRISNKLAYRLYVREYAGNNTETASGGHVHDHWSKPQGGFRLDWTPSAADSILVEGDAYQGSEARTGAPDEGIDGRNLTVNWTHGFADGSSLQILGYYDHAGRVDPAGGNFHIDTFDLDAQHSFALGQRNQIVWGGGLRVSPYRINGTPSLFFAPASRTLTLANAFVQDTIAISDTLSAVLGMKLEDDPYSGVTPLPSGRIAWKPNTVSLLWAAISRAIRSPTPFDRDVVEQIPGVRLTGNPDFRTEKLTAYEIGGRMQPSPAWSFSVSAFYNVYNDLRSIELTPDPSTLILSWGNGMQGYDYGFEAWSDYQLLPWWRLSASFSELVEQFGFKAGSSGLLGVSQIGDDPRERAALRSSMDLGPDITLDADLRYVGVLPDPHVPAFVELDASVGWNVSQSVRLSLSGFDLLHARHQEFPAPDASAVPRSFSVGMQWRF